MRFHGFQIEVKNQMSVTCEQTELKLPANIGANKVSEKL